MLSKNRSNYYETTSHVFALVKNPKSPMTTRISHPAGTLPSNFMDFTDKDYALEDT